METHVEEEYYCKACSFTSSLPNDVCPECGGKMVAVSPDETDPENLSDDQLTDDTFSADGTPDSLEQLAESELDEDYQAAKADRYGDE